MLSSICGLTLLLVLSLSTPTIADRRPLLASSWRTIPVDGAPSDILVADLNGDSLLDIVLPNGAANAVAVAYGGRGGRFLAPRYFPAGPSPGGYVGAPPWPTGVVHGDFNGDELPDLAMANRGNAAVSILLNGANGDFGPPANFAAGPSPLSLAAGDLDADGDLDLVVGDYVASALSILIGDGAGSFTTGTAVGVGRSPRQLRLADVNGDGHLDVIVIAFGPDEVRVLLGTGAGTFQLPGTAYATGENPLCLAVGDLDGDGAMDVVVGDWWGDLTWFAGSSNGTFTRMGVLQGPDEPVDLELGDLDGDGLPDIVAAHWTLDHASVHLNRGGGAFSPHTRIWLESEATGIAVGHIDGDPHLDVIVGSDMVGYSDIVGGGLVVYPGNGNGTFGSLQTVLQGHQRTFDLSSADMDADGDLDLLVARQNPHAVTILPGGGSLTPATTLPLSHPPHMMVAADFDQDGNRDLAVLSRDSSTVTILTRSPGPGWVVSGILPTLPYPRYLQALDIDGDGHVDLLFASPGNVYSRILPGNGAGGFHAARDVPIGSNFQITAVDMNGDGRPDLVVVGSRRLLVLLQDSSGSFATGPSGTITLPNHQSYRQAVADLNHDGRLDVLIGDTYGRMLQAFLGDGAGRLVPGPSRTLGWGYSWDLFDSFELGDLNADGVLDLVFPHLLFHGIQVVLGVGDGSFVEPMRYGMGEGTPGSCELLDYDGDAITDVLAGSSSPGAVSLLRGVQPGDITSVSLSVVSAETVADEVRLVWFAGGGVGDLDVWRSESPGLWSRVGAAEQDGEGFLRHVDRVPAPGRYCYRLRDDGRDGAGAYPASEVCLEVQGGAGGGVRLNRNPARGRIEMTLEAQSPEHARVEVVDVGGRVVQRVDVPGGAMRRSVQLAVGHGLPAGVYHVRVTQGPRRAWVRAVILR